MKYRMQTYEAGPVFYLTLSRTIIVSSYFLVQEILKEWLKENEPVA